MGGLVGYVSSSDDEEMQDEPQPQATHEIEKSKPQKNEDIPDDAPPPPNQSAAQPLSSPAAPSQTAAAVAVAAPTTAPTGPVQGPSLPSSAPPLMGPSLPPPPDSATAAAVADDNDDDESSNNNNNNTHTTGQAHPTARPASPYSANAALLRDLTLPPVPDLDIPPSPPGTPPPSAEALTKKFDTFLDLKRTKGTHFNARLAQSSRLTNPAVMDKLLGFVGVETAFPDDSGGSETNAAAAAGTSTGKGDPVAQYATTLSAGVWDPAGFPEWAFRGALKKSAEAAARRGRGEPVEFVKAAAEGGGDSRGGSRAGTPSGLGKRKTRFD